MHREENQLELTLDEKIEKAAAHHADLIKEKQAEIAEKRTAALQPVLEAIREHGFTAAELGIAPVAITSKEPERASIAPKYRDPVSGNTWVGRGKMPVWMDKQLAEGKVKEDFLINKPAPEYNVLLGLNVAPQTLTETPLDETQ